MPKKNEIILLDITDITQEGAGVGHLNGMAVFVPGAAVGDRLRVRLVKINKTHCFGKLEQIITPSPDRIQSDCPVSRRCGGCVFRHVSYSAELVYKRNFVQNHFTRLGKLDVTVDPVIASPHVDGYRNKAQYPVRMQKGELCAGFFAPRTHQVIDCRACRLQPSLFEQVLETVLAFVRRHKISVYDEQTQKGLLRHVYLRQGRRSQELMVCLVINGHALPHADELVQILSTAFSQLVSVQLNHNTQNTNVILGKKNTVLYGKSAIQDTLCGVRVEISPLAFYQVNSPGAELLYGLAADYAALTGNEILLDLYCGAGTIGLSMAGRCKQVIGVETVSEAVENARRNAAANDIGNARFYCEDASQAAARLLREGTAPDVVVLDPPRKGCDTQVLDAVSDMCPARIVMISCNSATAARDCAYLTQKGYTVQKVTPVDMFPRTSHVETVVLMSRANK